MAQYRKHIKEPGSQKKKVHSLYKKKKLHNVPRVNCHQQGIKQNPRTTALLRKNQAIHTFMARVQGYENKRHAKQQAHQKIPNNAAAAFKMLSLPRQPSQLRFHSLVKHPEMICNDMT